jgi:toxin ParE1/3/4
MMQIQISNKAQDDLIEIWEYTFEKWSINQADKYYEILIDAINAIANEPNLGKNYEYVRKRYYGFHIKSHIIFYRINNSDTLEVIRILHQRMDLPNRLK